MTRDPSNVVARINGEVVVVLGWGRAILLQVAHPLVAAAVSTHSDYAAGPRQYVTRTRRTVGAMLRLTFGTPEEVRTTADRINAIHRRVNGRTADSARAFPKGSPYTATDPTLLAWVHATLIDSQLRAYEQLVAPLSADDRDAYCAQAAAVAPLLAIPEGSLPETAATLAAYLERRYADGTVEVGETARRLAHDLLRPPGGVLTAPIGRVGRLVTGGLLPPAIRDAYGVAWSARRERRFERLSRVIRSARARCPARLREWPAARTAAARNPVRQ